MTIKFENHLYYLIQHYQLVKTLGRKEELPLLDELIEEKREMLDMVLYMVVLYSLLHKWLCLLGMRLVIKIILEGH